MPPFTTQPPPTQRQLDVLFAIASWIERAGAPPTFRELVTETRRIPHGRPIALKTAAYHVGRLRAKGLLHYGSMRTSREMYLTTLGRLALEGYVPASSVNAC